jgi:hypothetical protein
LINARNRVVLPLPRHQSSVRQLLQRRQMKLMFANHQRWFGCHVHHGEEATSVGQTQIALGRAGVEAPLTMTTSGGQCSNQGDQFVVAADQWCSLLAPTIASLHPHRATSSRMNVGDVGIVQQGLQRSAAQHDVDGVLRETEFVVRVPIAIGVVEERARRFAHHSVLVVECQQAASQP